MEGDQTNWVTRIRLAPPAGKWGFYRTAIATFVPCTGVSVHWCIGALVHWYDRSYCPMQHFEGSIPAETNRALYTSRQRAVANLRTCHTDGRNKGRTAASDQ